MTPEEHVSPEPCLILLVEDEAAHADIVQRAFERHSASFQLTVVSTLAEAAHAIESRAYDLVIADWRLPDGEGIDLLKGKPRFPLLLMTSHGNEQMAVNAMRSGALDYVVKTEASLIDMPKIADRAIRLWTNQVAVEVAQEKLRIAEETIRTRRKEEEWFRLLADAMPQIVWTARPDGYLDYYNRRWYDFTGFSPGAGGDDSWIPIVHPDDRQHCMDVWYSAVATGETFEINYRFWDRARSSFRWHLGRAVPLRDGLGTIIKWIGTCTDIDDHKRLSEELEQRVADRTIALNQSLLEKTTLLKEVHHRVKNNLQVICSLLSMQVACSDIALTAPLQEAHRRVVAMSLIHERIYRSEALSDLEFGGYIKLLSGHLFQAYCIDASRVRLDLEVETIHLSIDDAIPCGLILNELLSNSLKHAFPGGRQGIIKVSLRSVEGDRFELAVADNGAGLPASFRIEDSRSLGLQIVRSLVRQLGADLKIGKGAGAAFTLICPLGADTHRRAQTPLAPGGEANPGSPHGPAAHQ